MIPLLRHLVHALLWDELAARRWVRGGVLFAGASLVQLAGLTWQQVSVMGWGEIAWRLGSAAVLGAGGMVTAGERNPRPPAP